MCWGCVGYLSFFVRAHIVGSGVAWQQIISVSYDIKYLNPEVGPRPPMLPCFYRSPERTSWCAGWCCG